MDKDYSQFLIKEYKYWLVNIHENQSYLGRCVVWCKRAGALDLTEATPEEQVELFIILTDLRRAVEKCFNPDWINYAFLGNEVRHLHGHLIPRYEKQKVFEGVTFTDERYGHNYITNHNFVISEDILKKIKTMIK